jgi:hypothetical protein
MPVITAPAASTLHDMPARDKFMLFQILDLKLPSRGHPSVMN